jgi:hypothetical protein
MHYDCDVLLLERNGPINRLLFSLGRRLGPMQGCQ